MDPLHLIVALGPLGAYLLVIGLIHLGARPIVTTGGRDLAALAFGISGLIIVGPMELFLPDAPARRFGPYVWLLLIALYGLGVTLITLLSRPRLVIYNVTSDQLRASLAKAADKLESQARWAGDCLVLPNCGVQLQVEILPPSRVGELLSVGPRQSLNGWRQLESELRESLEELHPPRRSWYGAMMAIAGVGSLLIAGYWLVNHHQLVAQGLRDMLNR
ncbi:MAG: hypothetical protein KDB14_22845 [Planctomycetales bacterium]|nr:hypothetical protein [Planctomycetales bacterium]